MKDNQWWKYMDCKPSEDIDLNKEIAELKRDNTLLSYDVATLTDRIKEMESNAKR